MLGRSLLFSDFDTAQQDTAQELGCKYSRDFHDMTMGYKYIDRISEFILTTVHFNRNILGWVGTACFRFLKILVYFHHNC